MSTPHDRPDKALLNSLLLVLSLLGLPAYSAGDVPLHIIHENKSKAANAPAVQPGTEENTTSQHDRESQHERDRQVDKAQVSGERQSYDDVQ